ncbi:hypothetical protein [Nonomuraea longispora]|uniref:hypothetical protein n=1 Tax=Nonomuraea longispora TaxID=1848320 RepID=UPI001C70A7E1|nr:hypothetical protein [Nonomuraea longispora]
MTAQERPTPAARTARVVSTTSAGMNVSICARCLVRGLLHEPDRLAQRGADHLGLLPGRHRGGTGQLVDPPGVAVLPQRRSLAPLFAHLTEWAVTNLDAVDRARRAYDSASTR